MTRTKKQIADMKSVKDAAPNCRKRKNPAQSERMRQRHEQIKNLEQQLAAEKEVGHNTAVALAQQITKLEDQLAAERKKLADEQALHIAERSHYREKVQTLVDALKLVRDFTENKTMKAQIDAALAKIQDQPVQLPMINDDPVVTLK